MAQILLVIFPFFANSLRISWSFALFNAVCMVWWLESWIKWWLCHLHGHVSTLSLWFYVIFHLVSPLFFAVRPNNRFFAQFNSLEQILFQHQPHKTLLIFYALFFLWMTGENSWRNTIEFSWWDFAEFIFVLDLILHDLIALVYSIWFGVVRFGYNLRTIPQLN